VLLASRQEDPAGKGRLDAAVRDTGMEPHVLVLRDVDYALDVVARGAVFVRATDVDGDANTVKEAMLLGVPVLATDLPGRPPGIHTIPRDDLGQLPARLRDLIDGADPDRARRNEAWVRGDVERNIEALLGAYREASGS
jgi:hypothetical protein